jgi:hypothetical protein
MRVHYASLCKIEHKLDALLAQNRSRLGVAFSWLEYRSRSESLDEFTNRCGFVAGINGVVRGDSYIADPSKRKAYLRFDEGGPWFMCSVDDGLSFARCLNVAELDKLLRANKYDFTRERNSTTASAVCNAGQ